MGELLRRYWWPIAPEAELLERPTKAIRLLGEDLVLYRDKRGNYGLIGQHCPHRRASLVYGFVEECGLRCVYHGWMFDETGACIDQPFERASRPEAPFEPNVRIDAYPVRSKAGLLWAYLGPQPAPCLLDWSPYYDRGYKQLMFTELPCNWFQCQENSIDPVHFEWLHVNWSKRQRGEPDYGARHLRVGFDEFEYGFIYRRIVEGMNEQSELWAVGRVFLWPNCLYVGGFDWTVPIDDERTLRIRWALHPLPGDRPFEQARIPYWYSPLTDPATGDWYTAYGTNQDYVAMVSQGTIADRTRENLRASDRGIVMVRGKFFSELEAMASGGDPKGVLRDESRNHRLPLPTVSAQREVGTEIRPEPLAGQPRQILDEMRSVWSAYSV